MVKMAETTGFEPATFDVTGRCSNQIELRLQKMVWVERIELSPPGWKPGILPLYDTHMKIMYVSLVPPRIATGGTRHPLFNEQ